MENVKKWPESEGTQRREEKIFRKGNKKDFPAEVIESRERRNYQRC